MSEAIPFPRHLVLTGAIVTGVLLALAVHMLGARYGLDLGGLWRSGSGAFMPADAAVPDRHRRAGAGGRRTSGVRTERGADAGGRAGRPRRAVSGRRDGLLRRAFRAAPDLTPTEVTAGDPADAAGTRSPTEAIFSVITSPTPSSGQRVAGRPLGRNSGPA